MDIKKTANLLINFTLKRLAEISGIIIFSAGILLFIALFSYSPEDPNFIFPKDTKIKNLLGFQGSFISDLFFQSFGFIAYLISFTYIITGINIFRLKEFFLIIENTFIAILYTTAPAIAVFARTNLIETVSEKNYNDKNFSTAFLYSPSLYPLSQPSLKNVTPIKCTFSIS